MKTNDIIESMVKPKKIRGISRNEYASIHYWLRLNYGRPDKCTNKDCEGLSRNYNWALLRGKEYERKLENFIQLCRSCHSTYDCTEETRRKISHVYKGKKQSPELVEARIAPLRGRKRPPHVIEAMRQAFSKPVVQLEDGKIVKVFPSITAAGEAVGVTDGAVWNCINGKSKTSGGFQWKYE